MAWKLSPAFTLASEIISSDAVYCVGVSHHECDAAISRTCSMKTAERAVAVQVRDTSGHQRRMCLAENTCRR
jgi:hypothetical protein